MVTNLLSYLLSFELFMRTACFFETLLPDGRGQSVRLHVLTENQVFQHQVFP